MKAIITSWIGNDDRASHWYVSLYTDTEKYSIERILSEEEAKAMNELDELHPNRMATWRAGGPTHRFDSVAEASAAAQAVFEVVQLRRAERIYDALEIEEVDIGDASILRRPGMVEQEAYVVREGTGWKYLPDHDPYAPEPGVDYTLETPPGWIT